MSRRKQKLPLRSLPGFHCPHSTQEIQRCKHKTISNEWRVKEDGSFTSESTSPTWDSSASDGSVTAALPLPLDFFFGGGLACFMADFFDLLDQNLSPFLNGIFYKRS